MTNELLATCWTWSGQVDPFSDNPRSSLDPLDRIAALARHGFTGADFLIGDLQGTDLSRIADALDASGVRHRQVELVSDWWQDGATGSVDEVLGLAEGIGATQIKASPDVDEPGRPADQLREAWIRFADRAGEIGAQLVIEPMPFSNLPSVEQGARFVQGAGHANAGVLVDYWHVKRAGSTLASLAATLDPDHLMAVELCDGTGPTPLGMSLAEDAVTSRALPGEGTWDVAGFVRAVHDIGFEGPWGIEMPAPWYLALPLDEALSRASAATRSVLRAI